MQRYVMQQFIVWGKGAKEMLIYLQMIESEEDQSKFKAIYKMYKGLMFFVANDILHNEHDAEDAVHQAFLSILKNLSKIIKNF